MKPAQAIRVEKGIALPSLRRQLPKISYPFQDMEVGNSFFIVVTPPEDPNRVMHRIYQQSVRFKREFGAEYGFTQRRVEGGVRCWRTK